MGKPSAWNPTETDFEKIKKWSSEGMTESSIAAAFGITRRTFWDKKRKHPEIQQAIDDGKTDDEQLCVNKLREIAFSGDKQALSALIFYMKSRHGWSDRPDSGSNTFAPTGVTLKQIDQNPKDNNSE